MPQDQVLRANKAFKTAYDRLMSVSGESDVRDALHSAFKALDIEPFDLEYKLASGPVDMALAKRRIIVETKARGHASPLRPGSKPHETQKDQVERYLRDAKDQWLGDLFYASDDDADRLRAFLTDGLSWWCYEISDSHRLRVVKAHVRVKSYDDLLQYINRFVAPSSRQYRLPVPDELVGELLNEFAGTVSQVYERHESEAQTKIALWRERLRGAGISPPDNEPMGQASLFVRHTVIVIAARLLKRILRGQGVSDVGACLDEIGSGFPAWLAECEEGAGIVQSMGARLDKYQWRGSARDRLKDAYHKLIAKKERKEFGEYYTPDWLAERVVDETLDDVWMDRAINAAWNSRQPSLDGLMVLDPACGSGTFLFHAARRLYLRIQKKHPRKMSQARQILTRLVVGMDVHPVAAEMAEATLEMALPKPRHGASDGHMPMPQVFLGDAMQTARSDDLLGDFMVSKSAQGVDLALPTEFVMHSAIDALIVRLVDAAVSGQSVDFPELSEEGNQHTKAMLKALTSVVANESNHVWIWHLRNMAGPVRMSCTKAGRIVANPPWLMANDTPDGARKDSISTLRATYGLENKELRRRRASTEGDLAAVVSACITDLYLGAGGRMGLVLPGGALINQNWEPWRSGCWHPPGSANGVHVTLTHAWSMDELAPPPFPMLPVEVASCSVNTWLPRTVTHRQLRWRIAM